MALENFAGPEHYTEFDPDKFIRDLKAQAEMATDEDAKDDAGDAGADSN